MYHKTMINGLNGISANLYQNAQSAHNIANVNSKASEVNLTKETTSQITSQRGVEANAQSIKTHDGMIGSLLDIAT